MPLNSFEPSVRLTLSSNGAYQGELSNPVYTLTDPIRTDDRMMTTVMLESFFFEHPSYFTNDYLSGAMTILDENDNEITTTFTSSDLPNLFPEGGYYPKADNSLGITQRVEQLGAALYYLNVILKTLWNRILPADGGTVVDTSDELIFILSGDAEALPFNGQLHDAVTPLTKAQLDGAPGVRLSQMITLLNYQMEIGLVVGTSNIQGVRISGPFVSMLGLDPNQTHELLEGERLPVQIPMTGHDMIFVECTVASDQMMSHNASLVKQTNLLGVVPTPLSPGMMEYYSNTSNTGRAPVAGSLIDSIGFKFNDYYGKPLLGLRRYVINILIDRTIPEKLPAEDKVSLHFTRKMNMEQAREDLRKRLRQN